MPPSHVSSAVSEAAVADHAGLEGVAGIREQTVLQKLVGAQSFWVAVALLALMLVMTALEPTFGTAENLTNISRNFAPIGIMALGMTVVLITGGIDLSVGSVMALVAIVAGLFLTWHYPWYVAFVDGHADRARLRRRSTASSSPMSACRPSW